MTGDFRQLSDTVWASPQIGLADVAEAKARGFSLIINNRPDGESADQIAGDVIAEAARSQGLEYCAIPVTHAGFSIDQVDAMIAALGKAQGKVLAYCRSGTRSTLLWALTQAKCGADPAELAKAAAKAGFDLTPISDALVRLSAAARG